MVLHRPASLGEAWQARTGKDCWGIIRCGEAGAERLGPVEYGVV